MRCDEVIGLLGPSMDDPTVLGAAEHAHLARCLRCQAEVARERRLRRSLAGLADVVLVPPDDLLEELYEALDVADGRTSRTRRAVWMGSIAAATAAAAGGAIVLATRGRRHRPALAG